MATERQFAPNDFIGLTPGTFVGTGAVSFVALVERVSDGATWSPILAGTSGATSRWAFGFTLASAGAHPNSFHYRAAGTTGDFSTTTVTVADGWTMIGACRPAGAATTTRYHIKKTASRFWTHENGSVQCQNALASDTLRIGYDQNDASTMKIAFVAAWDSQLADSAYDGMSSVQRVLALAPQGAWLLDQSATSLTVYDLIRAQNQSGISGTTVITEAVTVFDLSRPKKRTAMLGTRQPLVRW